MSVVLSKKYRIAIEDVKIQVCRVCLYTDNAMMSLFEPYKESCVSQHIVAITDIKMSPGDGLPDRICSACLEELETAIHFKEKCEISNIQLQRNFSEEPAKVDIKKEELEDYEQISYLDDGSGSDHDIVVFGENAEQDSGSLIQEDAESKKDMHNISPKHHVECHDCGEVFRSKCKLRVHWKKTHKPKTFTCDICRRVFKSVKAFNNHKKNKTKSCTAVGIEGVRVVGEGKFREFHCSFCDYKSNKASYMKSHAVTHNGMRPYPCDLCPNSYTQTSSLINHKEQAHKQYRVQITCNFCGKVVKGRNNAYRHLQKHSAKRYQCDICKKLLKNKKCLLNHLKRHSGVKNKTCEECGDTFYTMSDLCNHKYKHTGVRLKKRIQCGICPYNCTSKKSIENHRMHHSDNNFPCITCGKFYNSETKLRFHEKCHNAEKKYECNLCNNRYKQLRYLSRHLKNKHKTNNNGEIQVDVKQEPKNQNQVYQIELGKVVVVTSVQ